MKVAIWRRWVKPAVRRMTSLCLLWGCCLAIWTPTASASVLDDIGVTRLRNADPTLTGSGIAVIHVEALFAGGTDSYQVNPSTVNLSPSQFTYIMYFDDTPSIVNSSTYISPNDAGSVSSHANSVANFFYGNTAYGVAPGVSTIDNYNADDYLYYVVCENQLPSSIDSRLHDARIVNQSFVFNEGQNDEYDRYCDWYAEAHDVLFISGIGNGGSMVHPASPSTAYNGIAVAAYGDTTPTIGPTTDGRSKPDVTAPGTVTSFSTPYVSGCAAVLMQAAERGDGGIGTETIAGHTETVKALLLNGAVKPAGWTNSTAQPLDITYGAGVVNMYNSWRELSSGQQAVSVSGSVSRGAAHMPTSSSNERTLRGWDYSYLSTTQTKDATNDYFFTLPEDMGGTFWLTATLVWNRHYNKSDINNLDLYLYNVTDQTLIEVSVSTVDNVEHLYVGDLDPGDTYSLQVWKEGGMDVSFMEEYALAYEFLMTGDSNGDGSVNGTDLNTVLSNYNQTDMDWAHGDFNRDGSVNGTDLNSVLSSYNQSYYSSTAVAGVAAVPEPGTGALIFATFAVFCVWSIRRRRS